MDALVQEKVQKTDTAGKDLCHWFCTNCKILVAFCGVDLEGHEDVTGDVEAPNCVVCLDIDECPHCGYRGE